MPLLQPQLELGIKAALNKAQTKENIADGNAALARELAKAIHLYVIAAVVVPGQVVVTAGANSGGPLAGLGATTSPGSLL